MRSEIETDPSKICRHPWRSGCQRTWRGNVMLVAQAAVVSSLVDAVEREKDSSTSAAGQDLWRLLRIATPRRSSKPSHPPKLMMLRLAFTSGLSKRERESSSRRKSTIALERNQSHRIWRRR
ncbi:hypothetical protein TIFTF001_018575 [Ficus carica]|uniref:Uncharacterized protein n=1 Tax=Ficus carica TaxID=3494 RepID=A0AA88A7A9_FICCA|nr:hypothetical protein TIFTF001_018575 [Ficus carica]